MQLYLSKVNGNNIQMIVSNAATYSMLVYINCVLHILFKMCKNVTWCVIYTSRVV